MKNFLLFIVVLLLGIGIQAAEYKDVTLPDEVTVDGVKKVLNGMAMREVFKFGFYVKIYVGGLYLKEKSSDADAILASPETKQIIIEHTRSIGASDMLEGWAGTKKGCVEKCEEWDAAYKEFAKYIGAVKKGTRYTFTFYPDRLKMETPAKTGEIKSASFSKNMLHIFIKSDQIVSEAFRKEMLGIKK